MFLSSQETEQIDAKTCMQAYLTMSIYIFCINWCHHDTTGLIVITLTMIIIPHNKILPSTTRMMTKREKCWQWHGTLQKLHRKSHLICDHVSATVTVFGLGMLYLSLDFVGADDNNDDDDDSGVKIIKTWEIEKDFFVVF